MYQFMVPDELHEATSEGGVEEKKKEKKRKNLLHSFGQEQKMYWQTEPMLCALKKN